MTPEHQILIALDTSHLPHAELIDAVARACPECIGIIVRIEALMNLGFVEKNADGLCMITAHGIGMLWELE